MLKSSFLQLRYIKLGRDSPIIAIMRKAELGAISSFLERAPQTTVQLLAIDTEAYLYLY